MLKMTSPTFFGNGKTIEEILKSVPYKFNVEPIGKLIRNSDTTRLAKRNRKKGIVKPPRRQNPWIIYRRDKSVNTEFRGMKSSDISKEISKMWKKEPKEVKELFEVLGAMSTEIHEKIYINYKYTPGPSRQSKKRHKKAKEVIIELPSPLSSPETPEATLTTLDAITFSPNSEPPYEDQLFSPSQEQFFEYPELAQIIPTTALDSDYSVNNFLFPDDIFPTTSLEFSSPPSSISPGLDSPTTFPTSHEVYLTFPPSELEGFLTALSPPITPPPDSIFYEPESPPDWTLYTGQAGIEFPNYNSYQ